MTYEEYIEKITDLRINDKLEKAIIEYEIKRRIKNEI